MKVRKLVSSRKSSSKGVRPPEHFDANAVTSPLEAAPAVVNAQTVPEVDFSRCVRGKRRAESTVITYKSEWRAFSEWCIREGASPLPASSETVARYLIARSQDSVGRRGSTSQGTLARRLASISSAHLIGGLQTPVTAAEVVEALGQIAATPQSSLKRVMRPLLAHDIGRMVDAIEADDSRRASRDTAVLLIGFAGALNSDQIRTLDVEALIEKAGGLVLEIRRRGSVGSFDSQQIAIPRLRGSRFCPVTAVNRWLSCAGITSGAVFRGVRAADSNTRPRLSNRTVNRIVKHRASAVGVDSRTVGGSSLRRGYIEQLRHDGFDVARIAVEARTRGFLTRGAVLPHSERQFADSPLPAMFERVESACSA